ncbi:MAG: right-handed parallel beta-helix repeat-containing protein [Mycobacterium sp.]|nr:right-handed parallel beta-helix repeat-containing protein [Mycobacterium sp.]
MKRVALMVVGVLILIGGIAVAASTAVHLNGGDTVALSCAGKSLSISMPNQTSANASCVPNTTTAAPAYYASGEARNATNTGLAGDTVSAAALTRVSGSITYGSAHNGQTISRKSYTGTVTITGSHITIKDCTLTAAGANTAGFVLRGNHNTVQNCTITSPAGQSMYEPVWVFGDSNSVVANNISRGENLITTYGTNVRITRNYLHNASIASNPRNGDPDGIEICGGGPTLIDSNRITEGLLYESPINVAPYNSYTVVNLTVSNNFLDNGQSMTLVDNQSTAKPGRAGITGTRILHNAFGGHTNPDTGGSFGRYKALENYENRPIVQTDASLAATPTDIEWPTSGAYVNRWEETQAAPALSPNRNGRVALPSCPSPC